VNEAVQVDIFGSQYTIRKGTEDPEYIARVAAYVDQKMREINERLPVASVSRVAVLASLNLADELFKEREGGSLGRDKNGLDRLEKCCAELDRALAGLE
jgi:cell division protein ZapA